MPARCTTNAWFNTVGKGVTNFVAKRDSFLLRIDPAVLNALRKWSEDELRSMNGQIEFVLRRALLQAGRLKLDSPGDSNASGESNMDQNASN